MLWKGKEIRIEKIPDFSIIKLKINVKRESPAEHAGTTF